MRWLLALLLATPAFAQDAVSQTPHLRDTPLAGFWITKALTIPQAGGWDAKSNYFGGRFHARMPAGWGGRVALIVRGDVVALPGTNPFKDIGAAKAVEAYGGAEVILYSRGRLDVGVAVIGGETFPFATEIGGLRPASQSLAAGGVVMHDYKSGAWAVALVGEYDAAGNGTRLIGSVHMPIKAGFALLIDYVSGDGGWLRPGVAYGVSW